MHRSRLTVMMIVMFALVTSAVLTLSAAESPKPKDRVVAIYFHRTERCPTCRKMGSYAEQAVKQKFAEQLRQGVVEFHDIDLQDEKNALLTKGYKISGPALVVAKVKQNKVQTYKNLTDIWSKVQEKPEFFKYVQAQLTAYLR